MFEGWWDDVHFGQAEVRGQVRAFHMGLDLGVPDWVAAVLVDPWVQGGHVHVQDLLTLVLVNSAEDHDCVGAAVKKGIPGEIRTPNWSQGRIHPLPKHTHLDTLFATVALMDNPISRGKSKDLPNRGKPTA